MNRKRTDTDSNVKVYSPMEVHVFNAPQRKVMRITTNPVIQYPQRRPMYKLVKQSLQRKKSRANIANLKQRK